MTSKRSNNSLEPGFEKATSNYLQLAISRGVGVGSISEHC